MISPRVILITDPAYGDDVIVRVAEKVAAALPSGAFCLQLRDKVRGARERRALALRLSEVAHAYGAGLVINGDVALARELAADGVHLGRDAMPAAEARTLLGPSCWISVAAHSDGDVRDAEAAGAHAALVSPIFATGDKRPRGVAAITSARAVARTLALYALGGVTVDNVGSCARAGAYGAALIRALLESSDPARDARAIHDVLAGAW